MAKVKFSSYGAATYLRIAIIGSIFAKFLLYALDKNYFAQAFFNFAKRGYFTRQTGKIFPASGSFLYDFIIYFEIHRGYFRFLESVEFHQVNLMVLGFK